MDESVRHHNPNPTLTANPLSKLFFWWTNDLVHKGYKRRLEESDMFNVCPEDSSKTLGDRLEADWKNQLDRQREGRQASLFRTLYNVFGVQFLLWGFVPLFEEMLKLAQPLLLAEFLDYFIPGGSTSSTQAWLYATGVVLCSTIIIIAHHPYFFSISLTGMRVRVGLCSMMYRKSLRLSNKSMKESSVGQIVNLMSNDVARFDQVVVFCHFLWVGPLKALVGLAYLWYRVGPSVLAAMAVLLVLMPAQGLVGRVFLKLRRRTAVQTDRRVKVMNEIISGIRIIKLYCWEKPFGHLVEKLRRQEIRLLHRARRLQAIHLGSIWAVNQAAIFLFILTLVLTNREDKLRPATVYLVMGILSTLRLTCGFFVPMAFQQIAETMVVIKRIQTFLLLDELEKVSTEQPANGLDPIKNSHLPDDQKPKTGVEVTHLTAKWDGNAASSNTLDDVTVKVSPGQLVAVIGPVGAGKTSLLMSILGELPAQTGTTHARGKIAYISQHPWIFSGSLRQNILFGEPFNKARYDKIIKISALSRDLTVLPNGDASLIGDRGINLSGGQKARVSLARALYMDADIYLLDDPLAAVDTTVGKHIFEKCIVEYLKEKPRILVTHQVQLLPVADNIVILTDGKIVSQGSYSELSKSGVDFSELLKLPEEEKREVYRKTSLNNQKIPNVTGDDVTLKRSRSDSVTSTDSLGEDYVPDSVQLPEEEERQTGNIEMKVFVDYFKACGSIVLFVLVTLFMVLAQVFIIANDWWLAIWTNDVEDLHDSLKARDYVSLAQNTTSVTMTTNSAQRELPEVDEYYNMYVYAGIFCAVLISSLAKALLFFKMAVTAAENLHNAMFARSLRATMAFFDTNPVGRVLNRFSKDVGQIDERLTLALYDFSQSSLRVFSIVIVASVVNPWVFIAVVPLLILFLLVRKYYVQSARGAKRLEGTTRSPVFSHLSASLLGLHTIRAMHMEQRLASEFDAHQDLHTEAWYLFLATTRWFSIRLDWITVAFTACVVYSAVLAADSLDAGFVGLSIVYTINLLGLFQWTLRQSVEVENQMISVERVLQYTRLPIEADLVSKADQKPLDTWPLSGSLQARGLNLRYSLSGPLVLKDINFDIKGGEKIGIVGRTGAGKSSLITALFRLVEPEGDLDLDGVSIHSLGLHDLRKVISIIPQDPVLFTGSVRRNLDPFDQYTDSQLWSALEEVQLKEAIVSNPDNLYMEVSEGGSNFSAGQRQLMCLARAVLGNTRILVIDEATANVDPITDELIQQTIRTKFKSCTVLTIAHRLHTVIDSDRLMVLDDGRIVEMGSPSELLSVGQGGTFYSMVEQLGHTELENLTQLATRGQLKSIANLPVLQENGVNYSSLATKVEETETDIPDVTSTNDKEILMATDAHNDIQGIKNEAFTPENTRL